MPQPPYFPGIYPYHKFLADHLIFTPNYYCTLYHSVNIRFNVND